MSKVEKVYLVVGNTGEYSDHTEWTVCGYFDRQQAELHVQMLNEAIKEIRNVTTDWEKTWEDEDAVRKQYLHLDSCLPRYWNESRYCVNEVSVFVHFDQFQENQEMAQ